jgi:hypothetical protein
MLSSAGRVQLEEALAPEAASISAAPEERLETEKPEESSIVEAPEAPIFFLAFSGVARCSKP